ncbi:MAG: VCBS repeat-containing protein, partial [Planctomycetales bacterium]|nr:VCBS repeat-containing protein [Planctomycetales bacterium]
HSSYGVSLGDLDGDGDLDAFVVNRLQANKVWLNDGSGNFIDSGQSLGNHNSDGVSLGDLDGDGDVDAFVANSGQGNRVWLNDGSGNFTDSGQVLGNHSSLNVSLGDLDGDGDLDAFVANNINQGNRVWLNNGAGVFSDSGQSLGNHNTASISLGDVDGDGDLDVFVANFNQESRVWLNDGNGNFTDSGQRPGDGFSFDVSLGDLDGDGDLDAFVVNLNQSNRVWLNNGDGRFTDSGQSLGNHNSRSVALGDLDGDGDLDAFVANAVQANRVWLNDGSGNFTPSGQSLGDHFSRGVSLGDLDGDGDLDAFVANRGQPNRVWLNANPPKVIDVIAAGSGWDATFIDAVDGDGVGAGNGLGYSLVGAHQLTTLPWQGIDTLYIVFDADVSASLADGDVVVTGTNGGIYSLGILQFGVAQANTATVPIPGGFDVDSLVLTLFDGAVTNAAGEPLNGEWTSGQSAPSGDASLGGQFNFFFNVLRGDENASGQVNGTDALNVFSSNTQATTEVNARRDINGSGQINSTDSLLAFGNNTKGLPVAPTPPAAPAPTAAVAFFQQQPIVAVDAVFDELASDEVPRAQQLKVRRHPIGFVSTLRRRADKPSAFLPMDTVSDSDKAIDAAFAEEESDEFDNKTSTFESLFRKLVPAAKSKFQRQRTIRTR